MRPFSETVELDQRIGVRYPRELTTAGGAQVTLTPMVPSDWQLLEEFLGQTPREERKFFRHETADPARVERWCSELDYRHTLPLLAWCGGRIVGDGVLEREKGLWTSHVGRLRLLVDPQYRRAAVGTELVHELIAVARELGLHKMVYECAAEQHGLCHFLEKHGFREVARLPEFIRDYHGELHDMVISVLDLEPD